MAPETGKHDGESNHSTVFIDTSLETHLATIVSDSDTVSDFKKKIILEHLQCFPAIGDIKIHCLKVKRRGNFYHLADSMLVKSAFGDAKRNWFVSVDASRLEQHDGIQQFDKHKVGDQLALPWVTTDSRSIDRQDNLADRPLKLSLVKGSPSNHPKIVPFVNQKAPSVDHFTSGDSCKDASENIEEHKSSNDDHWRSPQQASEKQLDSKEEKLYTSNKEIKSKKRIHDVHNESALEDALASGPSVKKKRRTQRVEVDANLKDPEENRDVIYDDNDKVKYKEARVADENSFEHIPKGKDLTSDGLVTTAATVVPSSVEDVGVETHPPENSEARETVPDDDMVIEKNIQEEMPFGASLKEKDNELVQEAVTGIEIPSSLMSLEHLQQILQNFSSKENQKSKSPQKLRPSPTGAADSEHDAPVVISEGHPKGAKRSAKHKAAEKEVSSTPSTKKLQKTNKDAIDSSQQDVPSTGHEFADDLNDKRKEDMEISLNQGPEVKIPEMSKETTVFENTSKKRKPKKSAAKSKNEPLVKHADISSSVPAPVFDDKITDDSAGQNEVSEKTLVDDPVVYAGQKGDDLIVKEVEVSEPTESHGRHVHLEEKRKTEVEDCIGSKRKKKASRKSASINDESVAKHTADAATATNEENPKRSSGTITNRDRSDDNPTNNAVEISRTEKIGNQVNAEDINENSKKENEKTDGAKKSKKKKKTKTSAARNEDESVTKTAVSDPALDGPLQETAKEGGSSLPDSDRKDNPNEKPADASQLGVDSVADKVKGNDVDMRKDGLDGKSRDKQNSPSQTLPSVPIEERLNKLDKPQDETFDEGLVRKAKKNHKSSVKARKDLQNKHQSTELELEPEKRKGIPEETSKNVAVSEVSNVRMEGKDDLNNEVDISKEKSQEIDFMNYFVPNKTASIDNVKDATRSAREKKLKKKTKGLLPHVETSADLGKSQVSLDTKNEHNKPSLSSKKTPEVSTDVVKDPNITRIDQIRTPKRAKLNDAPKTNKSAHANKGQDGPSESSSSSETFGRSFHNQKSNKQQSIQGQSRVKTLKKGTPVVNNSHVKSLLNKPGTIFADGSDTSPSDENATVDSDSSTRTPSKSSSSEESDSSIDSKRNGSHAVKSGGKNNMNSQSKVKSISMADLLRSSSRFKKAKLKADTESEPVDFVPESQPI